ncbi:Chromosome partitioning ATPase, Mrp family, contains Fe-S cluster [Novosphingobium sp. CF614]|uniref:capsular biosynthesis protein n=1 Tax=Novosphingobium sp. CF614 TaxID=1884364 RepID=UPI0008EFB659|nr:capsular biosynthesis protein [Novosphingobium sp. CF614]SFG27738.1 Chromosome partitioning ATPase, Mrp family, contains Fe-S cluster [Novosphingobium sp. CF614]
MTDQSKIPMPLGPDAPDSRGESLIERVAGRFDLNSFIGKPIPLPPEAQVRARVLVAAAPAPVNAADPLPEPRMAPQPVPSAGVPEPMAEVPEAVDAAAEPAHEFHGEPHPIDRERLREQGLIVPEGTVTALLEEFRIVKRQLLVQSADLRRQKAGAMAQRVLVSSPHPGEGKTYCALNLALSIAAEKESEVLLVDADFAKPSILSALGLPGGPGLMDALMDESVDVMDYVLGTDIPGLWVLPAGDTTNHDSEYLSSSRTARVLDCLTARAPHRMVIFDSPPALAASPAAELAKYVGQVVVIVRADRTGQGALEDAIQLLSACPNVQLLLNGAQFSPSGRSFGTYYGYRG